MAKRRKKKCLQPFWEQQWLFRKCVQSCGWRAVGSIDALRFEIGKNRKSLKLNTNSRSSPIPPLCIAKYGLQKLRFLCIPKDYWLIDMYTIMHNEKMGKIQQVQNNHLPETLLVFRNDRAVSDFSECFFQYQKCHKLKLKKTRHSVFWICLFFFPWSLSLFRSFQHEEKYREVEPKRTRS